MVKLSNGVFINREKQKQIEHKVQQELSEYLKQNQEIIEIVVKVRTNKG